jgi:hypothetical protein
MTSTCPNCNQTVLPTDTVCWHCGYRWAPQPPKHELQPEPATAVTAPESFSLSAVLVYGGVTAVVLIGLLLAIRTLGQRPTILLNPDTNISAGWPPVTDHSMRFTLDIPPTWQAWDKQNPQQQAEFETVLASDEQFTAAVASLSTAVSDLEILMIVIGEKPEQITAVPGFIVVARSEEIGRLSLDDIIALAQRPNAAVELSQVNIFSSFTGDNRVSASLKMPATKDALTCQQHVIRGTGEGYLLAGCAPEARYQTYSEPIENILASFQLLR